MLIHWICSFERPDDDSIEVETCCLKKISCNKLLCLIGFIPCMNNKLGGTRWRSWLRHCATNWKVACSIPDGVIGFFNSRNPSGPTMALGGDSASNINEYQECFLGAKAAGA